MALYDNSHEPTNAIRTRVKDLAVAGIPQYLIARIIGIDKETLTKYYDYELETGLPEAVHRIANVVAMQAESGCQKSQALFLKTRGAQYGWVEKQIVETVNSDETNELKDKIKELEGKFDRDY
jgi:hypothetical protein